MKYALLFIVVMITVGFVFSLLGLGQHGMLFSFLAAFGLLMVIVMGTLLVVAKKRKDS